jgi:hypothetical protein
MAKTKSETKTKVTKTPEVKTPTRVEELNKEIIEHDAKWKYVFNAKAKMERTLLVISLEAAIKAAK